MSNMIERLCSDVNRFAEERQIDCATSLAGDLIASDLKTKTIKGVATLASMPVSRTTADIVTELLLGEDKEDIFCSACEVRQLDWDNATKFYGSSLSSPAKPLDLLYSSKILKMAHELVINRSLYGYSADNFSYNKSIYEDRRYFAKCILVITNISAISTFLLLDSSHGYLKYVLPIAAYCVGLLLFFRVVRTPSVIKLLVSKFNAGKIIELGWILLIPLIIWGGSFALRLAYFGAPEDYDNVNELKNFKNNYQINYAISSVGGLLDSWKIKRDDVYGVVTVAVSSWLSLTLGYEKAKNGLRAAWLGVGAWKIFAPFRKQLRGGKP